MTAWRSDAGRSSRRGRVDMDDEARMRARKIAESRYGFLWHLPIYLIVNIGLVGIWYFTDRSFFWPIFPIFFWGIGLFSHYMTAYRAPGSDWVERETQKILDEGKKRGAS
jgi:hypothetical protein